VDWKSGILYNPESAWQSAEFLLCRRILENVAEFHGTDCHRCATEFGLIYTERLWWIDCSPVSCVTNCVPNSETHVHQCCCKEYVPLYWKQIRHRRRWLALSILRATLWICCDIASTTAYLWASSSQRSIVTSVGSVVLHRSASQNWSNSLKPFHMLFR